MARWSLHARGSLMMTEGVERARRRKSRRWRWLRVVFTSGALAFAAFVASWIVVETLAEPGTEISLPWGITYVKGDGFQRLTQRFSGDDAGTVVDGPILSGADIDIRSPARTMFRDCETCPIMIVVPPGSFMMGAAPSDQDAEADERPQRLVTIERPFAMGVFEVTFDEWDAGVRAGRLPRATDQYEGVAADFGWGRGRRPVINVSWDDANAYIRWLNDRLGAELYRLPSEAEWEYAARGGTQTRFSFGDHFRPDLAWIGEDGTVTVGRYPPNPWGLYDVQGNVWEWTADCWHPNYEGAPTTSAPWIDAENCERHAIRGGSWGREGVQARLSNRLESRSKGYRLGFRVARHIVD